MISWIYLILAASQEVLWIYSLKFMDLTKVKKIAWDALFNDGQSIRILLPIAGFIVFGAGCALFLSFAMRNIPASVAFAVWMGISLTGIKLVDVFFLKEPFNYLQFFYFACILVGIIGLKKGI